MNCVTELLPERALARAGELDAYYAEHKQPIGPLHGLPISVKEHVGMKGLDMNAGFMSWVGDIAEGDAHVLQILWKAGCVFYVRTTEPQGLVRSLKFIYWSQRPYQHHSLSSTISLLLHICLYVKSEHPTHMANRPS